MSESKELSAWEEKLKAQAVTEFEEENKSGGSQILSTKGKKFSLGDNVIGTEIDVVMTGSAYELVWYDRAWKKDVVTPPACFAIGVDEQGMVANKTSPVRQADACDDCAFHQWEDRKPPICKSYRRVALMAYGDEGLGAKEVVLLKIAPTGLKNFKRYAKTISMTLKRPTWSVITKLSFDPKQDYPVVVPTLVRVIDNADELTAIEESKELTSMILMEPYDVSSYVAPEVETPATAKRRSKMS